MSEIQRKARGNGLVELGPVMLVMTVLVFFPIVDLVTLGPLYIMSYHLNQDQLRQAAVVNFSDAQSPTGSVQTGIANQWVASGLGSYSKAVISDINTTVEYQPASIDDYGNKYSFVKVSTSVTVKPFLVVPFPISVSGLNAPIQFSFVNQRLVEDPTNAPQY